MHVWRWKPISELIWYVYARRCRGYMQTSVKEFFFSLPLLFHHSRGPDGTEANSYVNIRRKKHVVCEVLLWRVQNWIPPMTLFPLEFFPAPTFTLVLSIHLSFSSIRYPRINSARQIDFFRCCWCDDDVVNHDYGDGGGYVLYTLRRVFYFYFLIHLTLVHLSPLVANVVANFRKEWKKLPYLVHHVRCVCYTFSAGEKKPSSLHATEKNRDRGRENNTEQTFNQIYILPFASCYKYIVLKSRARLWVDCALLEKLTRCDSSAGLSCGARRVFLTNDRLRFGVLKRDRIQSRNVECSCGAWDDDKMVLSTGIRLYVDVRTLAAVVCSITLRSRNEQWKYTYNIFTKL